MGSPYESVDSTRIAIPASTVKLRTHETSFPAVRNRTIPINSVDLVATRSGHAVMQLCLGEFAFFAVCVDDECPYWRIHRVQKISASHLVKGNEWILDLSG